MLCFASGETGLCPKYTSNRVLVSKGDLMTPIYSIPNQASLTEESVNVPCSKTAQMTRCSNIMYTRTVQLCDSDGQMTKLPCCLSSKLLSYARPIGQTALLCNSAPTCLLSTCVMRAPSLLEVKFSCKPFLKLTSSNKAPNSCRGATSPAWRQQTPSQLQ